MGRALTPMPPQGDVCGKSTAERVQLASGPLGRGLYLTHTQPPPDDTPATPLLQVHP
jgi:hypothetical protein